MSLFVFVFFFYPLNTWLACTKTNVLLGISNICQQAAGDNGQGQIFFFTGFEKYEEQVKVGSKRVRLTWRTTDNYAWRDAGGHTLPERRIHRSGSTGPLLQKRR